MSYTKIPVAKLQELCSERLREVEKFKFVDDNNTRSQSKKLYIKEVCNRLLCLCELADNSQSPDFVYLSREDAYFIYYNLSLM